MIREKIFRLHRHKSSLSSSAGTDTDASGQKFDFTFSNIHAIQVRKGWDKVSVSLISSESGKTVRKSGKVAVRNGTCRWSETLSESIWISEVDGSKNQEEYLLKFLISTGSSRSGVLGEATLNLAAFLSSESPMVVSLPLKKCNYGTILQVEVRCLTPKPNLRDEKWKEMNAHKDESTDHNGYSNSPRVRELGSREASSASRYSFESMDDSISRQSISSQSDWNANMGRQDSIESNDSASYNCSYSPVKSVRSLQKEELRRLSHASSLQQNGLPKSTSKEIQELEAEARMWEQNARKLAADVDSLRKELSDQKLNTRNLNMELVNSHSECREFAQEIERLRSLLEESKAKEHGDEIQEREKMSKQKELEDEIRFQEKANEDLCMQLRKAQESNIELISVLQEREENIEKQKADEIESLSTNKLGFIYSKDEINADDEVSANGLKSLQDSDLEIELLDSHDLRRTLQSDILTLEITLEKRIIESEIEQDLKNRIMKEFVYECNRRLDEREQKIKKLEDALSKDVSKEKTEELKEKTAELKIRELEKDCNELTAENLELLFQLNESRKNASKGRRVIPVSSSSASSTSDANKIEHIVQQPKKKRKKNEILHEEASEDEGEKLEVLSKSTTVRDHELQKCHEQAEIIVLQKHLSSENGLSEEYKSVVIEPNDVSLEKVNDIKALSCDKCELKLQENVRSIERDCVIMSSNSVSDMISESNQNELLKHLSGLQEENTYLSQRVSGLEAQLRYLTDTNESSCLELQSSKSQVVIFEDQIRRLEEEIELQKLEKKHKLLDKQMQLSEAQEECKSLNMLNIRLQATTESLIEEYNLLQKFNGELREQKLKLQNHCMVLENSLLDEETIKNLETSERGNKVVLAANQEKVCDNIMKNGSKYIFNISEVESQARISELERLCLAEENAVLNMQLKRVPELQNDVLALRISLKEMKSQNQLLEASLMSLVREYEELKSERVSMIQKNSTMQKEMSEMEDCRRKRNSLEEKILRLEGDLIARDSLSVQNVELKNELNRINIANSQFLVKVKYLEDVREDLRSRVKSLEDALKQTSHAEERQVINKQDSHSRVSQVPEMDYHSRIRLLEDELAKALNENDTYKSELERFRIVAPEKSESKEPVKTRAEDKISLLETELQEIRERYLQISLKYAEVEAQREELVMKLKALNYH